MASVAPSVKERFWAKVDQSGGESACWPWTGSVIASNGYGQMMIRFTDGTRRNYGAHRLAAAWAAGDEVPTTGLQTDHLCHDPLECNLGKNCPHRRCCNPAHLEIVTPGENNARSGSPSALNAVKTECPKGHPYDEVNTYVDSQGRRSCKPCMRQAHRDWVARGGQRKSKPKTLCPSCNAERSGNGFRNGVCASCDRRNKQQAAKAQG